jgi:hypothetical protein
MRHWFKDTHFRSLLKNSSYLAVSKTVAGLAGVATLAFAGRGLGLAMFGTLILIVSYAKAASGISKFQSWQLIVRYGGSALASGEHEEFKTSTGFAFALDVVSGIGGMIIAVALLPFIGPWFGVTHDILWLAMLYCTLLPTMGAATPTGRERPIQSPAPSWRALPSRPAPRSKSMSASGSSPTLAAISTCGSSPGVSFGVATCYKAFAQLCGRRLCPAPGVSRSTSI